MASDSGFSFLPQGAIIQEFKVAGHNIVLGYPDPEPYANSPFFGETIGRVANRIKNAEIEVNGKSYKLSANEGPNQLHGGSSGWGKKTFHGPQPVNRGGKEAVLFTYFPPTVKRAIRARWSCECGIRPGQRKKRGYPKPCLRPNMKSS